MIPNIVLTSAGAALLAKIPAGEAAQATGGRSGKGALRLEAAWTGRLW